MPRKSFPKPKSTTVKLAAMTASPNEHEAQRAQELLNKVKPINDMEYTGIVNKFLTSIGEETVSHRKLWALSQS